MNPNQFDFSQAAVAENEMTVEAGVPEGFRRLEWHEPVLAGDFVMDERRGFEAWEGPPGFRADSFVKPIYRRSRRRAGKAEVKS
jgi:hypothetical protein